MADKSIPVPTLSEASQLEAVAPSSVGGWAKVQREYNTVLPLRLAEMDKVLAQVDAVLAGESR